MSKCAEFKFDLICEIFFFSSNSGQPVKKFVKNDFTNQVKFELSTLRHYLQLSTLSTKILEVNLFAFAYRLFH